MHNKLWPPVPPEHRNEIHAMVSIEIMAYPDVQGKPVLKLTFGDKVVYCTANTGEMLGGAASGARLRWEDFNPQP